MANKREIEPLNFDYRNQFSAKRSRAKLVLSTIESGKTHQNQFSPACESEIGFLSACGSEIGWDKT